MIRVILQRFKLYIAKIIFEEDLTYFYISIINFMMNINSTLKFYRFTSHQAFKNVLKETNDLAGQREIVAENLQSQVIAGISLLSKTLRDDRKKALQEGADLQQNLASQLAALDRAKKNYEKAYREAEKAVENYQKADADFNLSRAEVNPIN